MQVTSGDVQAPGALGSRSAHQQRHPAAHSDLEQVRSGCQGGPAPGEQVLYVVMSTLRKGVLQSRGS